MGWLDNLANSVGISSKSLGINTAEDKAKRAAEAAAEEAARKKQESDAAFAADYDAMMQRQKQLEDLRNAQSQYDRQTIPSMADMRRADNTQVQNMPQAPSNDPSTFSKVMSGIGNGIGSGVKSAGNWIENNPNATSALAGIGSGVGGYLWAKDDYDKAMADMEQSAKLAGTYEALGPAQAAGVADDQSLIAMQKQALNRLQQEATAGTTPEDEAYRRQQQNAVNQQFKAREQQAEIENQRRGVQAGSGLALAQSLSNQQAGLQQASQASDADILRKAEAKRQATNQLASQSGQMQQDTFNRNFSRANATDAFNKQNIANKMQAAQQQANATTNVANARGQLGANKASTATSIGNVVASAAQNAANQKKDNSLVQMGKKFLGL